MTRQYKPGLLPRRRFLRCAAGVVALTCMPARTHADGFPTRVVPRSGEKLPVIGLGSTKVVSQLETRGTTIFKDLLRTLLNNGGKVVDTWQRDAAQDRLAGEALQADGLVHDLFIATKVDAVGVEAGRAILERTRRLFGKDPDLIQVISLRDLENQWPLLKDYKDAGKTRYIGATVSTEAQHEDIMKFMRNEQPDFIQVNYSVVETAAESSVLPLAADLGIAVMINRPFMNGSYFAQMRGATLPKWTAEFDCHSWAQFSLKYILSNPAVTCVLTETTKTKHLLENLNSAFGRLPDATMRKKMRNLVQFV